MFTATAKKIWGGTILGIGCAAMIAPAALGQAITHGDSTFTLPTATSTGATVRTGVAGGTTAILIAGGDATDQLFQQWWWFRVNGVDSREYALSNRTSNTASGNVLTLRYTEPEGFQATLRYTLTDGPNAPAACNVAVELQLTNTRTTALDLALFYYLDFDLEGAADDSATFLAPGRIRITDNTGFYGETLAVAANFFQVGAYPAVRNNLTDFDADNFFNTGLPFAAADFSGALQWNLTIPPGASQTVRAAFALNSTAVAPVPCRADFNGDAVVNSQDFFDFLAAFFTSAPSADFNTDGTINSQDFFDFLTEFFAGCG